MTDKLIPGDKVVSNKYGPGRVTDVSKAKPGAVLVTYSNELRDCAYNQYTGHRLPRFGNDRIELAEVPDGDN